MPRPRNMDERKPGGWGAYVWSHYLLADSEPHCNDRLGRTLKALAQESTKRISVSTALRYGTSNNVDYKTAGQRNAWYNYFVAAFEKILRELPPPDASAEQVREKRREFHQQRRIPALPLPPPPVQVQHEAAAAATPPETQTVPGKTIQSSRARKESEQQEPTRDNFIVYIPANVKVVLVPEGPADATFCIKSESSTASMSMSSTGTSSAAEDTLPASPPSVPLFPPMRWSACPSMDSLSSDTYSQDQRPSPAQGSKEPSPAQDSNSLSLSLAGYNINIPY
ncbi:hypothetical protein NEUTE1DRAFT_119371, partial [Neurospora tetrasperma FGSC 2508]